MEVKYQSKSFSKMRPDEIDLWADALLLKIHAITGWSIPEKTILVVFTDQFRKKLVESYPTANPDEIEYAFRQAGTTVKDWGKSMNLSLIDEVMIPYLQKRFEISRVEEQKKQKMIENKFDMSDQELWDSTEKLVKKGTYSIEMIPSSLYKWLDGNPKETFITKEKKYEYIERATMYRHGELARKFEKDPANLNHKKALSEFNQARQRGYFEGSEAEIVKELAKKMIVFDVMKSR